MVIRFLVRCFLILSIFSHASLWAVVYGSETAVSVLPVVTFPTIDNDNTMLGFGWFKNGFTFEDSSTTCTFNSVYPVVGTLALNGGSLYLQEDFIITNTSSITGGANIIGNNHMVQLCDSVGSLDSTYTFKDVVLSLGGDIEILGQLVFDGNCQIMGKSYHMEFGDEGSILVTPGSRLVFDIIDLDDIQGTNIACVDDSAQIVLHDTEWRQVGDFTFGAGSLEFSEFVDFSGSYTFWYDSSQTSTIGSDTCWTITDDMTLKTGRKNAVDYVEPFYFVDETSTLKLDNCSLIVTGSGIGLSKGKFELDRDVTVDVLSSSTLNGLIIGTGLLGGDFSMKLNPGAAINLLAGWWVYNNVNATGRLHALSPTSRCIRYADSKFCVQKDWTIPPMIFQVDSGMPVSILEPGVNFRYDKTDLITPVGELTITGGDLAPGFKLAGNDVIYLNDGVEPLPIYVSGMGNKLHGNGNITAPITLQDSAADLCCLINGTVAEDITMNGGMIMLMGDFKLGLDAVLSGSGVVDLATYNCAFGTEDQIWTSTLAWDNGSISLNSQITLLGTWTFENSCVVDGNGNMLDLDAIGKLVIADGASVAFRNMRIRGILGDQIKCLGTSSKIILDDVVWEQSGDVMFAQGALQWEHDVVMKGNFVFAYQSGQISTILAESTLKFDQNFTFSYDPVVLASKDLFAFEDSSSELILNGATLSTTVTGLTLKNGTIQVIRNSFLSSEIQRVVDEVAGQVTLIDEGITLGGGTGLDDIELALNGSSILKLTNGSLYYNNTIASSLRMQNMSSVISIDSGAALKLYQSMNLGDGIVVFGDSATLACAAGKVLIGSIQPLGKLNRIAI